MKTKTLVSLLALLNVLSGVSQAASLGTAFTYQGRLSDGGQPANGSYDLRLAVYDAASGPAQVGHTVTNGAVAVTDGLFTTTLDFGIDVFTGNARWLEMGVRTNGSGEFYMLSPRQALTPAPYALYTPNAGMAVAAGNAETVTANGVTSSSLQANAVTSDKIANGTILEADLSPALAANTFWRLAGNAGTTPGTHFLGTTDMQPFELKVNGLRALRLEDSGDSTSDPGTIPDGAPNLVGGSPWNYVEPGVVGAVIGGGGATNWNGAAYTNAVLGDFGVVVGGSGNRIALNSSYATVSGGFMNDIETSAYYSTIGGGNYNNISASSRNATIAGGFQNNVGMNANSSAIGGGDLNSVAADSIRATIAGGYNNMLGEGASYSSVGGGYGNRIAASTQLATISGGRAAQADHYGQWAYAGGAFSAAGDAQTCLYVLRGTTSGQATNELFLNGSSARLTLRTNSAITFHIQAVGRSDVGVSAGYEFRGVIERDATGTTAFVGTVDTSMLKEGASALNFLVEASDSLDALVLKGVGATGRFRWVATVRTTEVQW